MYSCRRWKAGGAAWLGSLVTGTRLSVRGSTAHEQSRQHPGQLMTRLGLQRQAAASHLPSKGRRNPSVSYRIAVVPGLWRERGCADRQVGHVERKARPSVDMSPHLPSKPRLRILRR